jgi:hypothetical protein
VARADGVLIIPDNLACVVDALCNGLVGGRGIVDCGVGWLPGFVMFPTIWPVSLMALPKVPIVAEG